MRLYISILICSFFLSCCKMNSGERKIKLVDKNTVIINPGEYCLTQNNICVKILTDSGFVSFVIKDSLNQVLFSNGHPSISAYQKWGVLLESNDSVWLQSSDRGLFVITKDKKGVFKMTSFNTSDINARNSIPYPIRKLFPRL